MKQRPEKPIVLGPVVAARTYRVGRRPVLLEIGTPRCVTRGSEWYCPFRITFGGKARLHRVCGIDAVQALQLVFRLIKTELADISPRIMFDGSFEPGDVGIGELVRAGVGLKFDRQLDRVVDQAHTHLLKQFVRESRARQKRRLR